MLVDGMTGPTNNRTIKQRPSTKGAAMGHRYNSQWISSKWNRETTLNDNHADDRLNINRNKKLIHKLQWEKTRTKEMTKRKFHSHLLWIVELCLFCRWQYCIACALYLAFEFSIHHLALSVALGTVVPGRLRPPFELRLGPSVFFAATKYDFLRCISFRLPFIAPSPAYFPFGHFHAAVKNNTLPSAVLGPFFSCSVVTFHLFNHQFFIILMKIQCFCLI